MMNSFFRHPGLCISVAFLALALITSILGERALAQLIPINEGSCNPIFTYDPGTGNIGMIPESGPYGENCFPGGGYSEAYYQATYYAEASYEPPYSEASYVPPYSEASYVPPYSEASYTPGICGNAAGTLTANPSRVVNGTKTQIVFTFSAHNASTCTLSGSGIALQTFPGNSCTINGTYTIPAPGITISRQTVYTLDCDGYTTTAVVNVIPKFQEF